MKRKQKKMLVAVVMMLFSVLARADTYVLTPKGLVTIMSAGGGDVLINNPNNGLTLCNYSGGMYLCGESYE